MLCSFTLATKLGQGAIGYLRIVGSYERRWGESATGVDLWLLLLCY
ncbi:hypothetical protein KSD_05470 [Ktedonobacter sp. SOSP1-85]|nr:hypothetical protein KSD_05470 [Ktedonobacter sp. SOSP1-85]